MITIEQPRITTEGGRSRLAAIICVDGVSHELWFEVDAKYEKFLCDERCDAFVLGLLHWAMKHGHDIFSEVPMTDRLYEQVVTQFLPAFYRVNNFVDADRWSEGMGYRVNIQAPLAPEVDHPADGTAIGAGCSCGVDSMHIYAHHPELTHACVWNVHGVTIDETKDVRVQGWTNLVAQARRFADAVHCELIVGDTNFDRGCIPDLMFDGSISFANLFFIYCLQKLWKIYYVASGYAATDFHLNAGLNADPAHYEYYLFPYCSLGQISVWLDGIDQNRLEKVRSLANYPLAKQFLNVCWKIREDGRNCTCYCPKCMRTLLDLAALDATEKFAGVFDIDYYNSHQEEFLAEYWRGLIQKNPYALEIRATYGRKKFSLSIRFRAAIIVIRKMLKKVVRLGGTSQRFSPRG